ncbi:hypothetical protein V6N11_057093 [Hibiscus sabdariffa]|uniref:Translation initiation factor IF-2 n=1 Tax=Hibiscus sabdariffa TaxID=183260 RepID=A0ABR1ZW99_9ROSI
MTQTREQLLLAKRVGISQMLVLLAKRVGISQLLQLVELEVRKLLCNYDFPDNGVPIVFGSALLVSQALMANPSTPRECMVAKGCIEQGTIKVGEIVDIVGTKDTMNTTVIGVKIDQEMDQRTVEGAVARDKIHLWLKGLQSLHHVLHNPLCFQEERRGKNSPFFAGYKPAQFRMRTINVTGKSD